MAAHYKWYPTSEETVVPFSATYDFPSQANKCVKTTPRIPPKSGSIFLPGNVIRVEFPAQGYVNALNTTLSFDVTLTNPGSGDSARFQNNIQSIFSRARILYGSTPLEDIPGYNIVVRGLTEWTATDQNNTFDQTSICEGIGGYTTGTLRGSSSIVQAQVNVRQNYIQGQDNSPSAGGTPTNGLPANATGMGSVPNASAGASNITGFNSLSSTRTYQISFAFGIMTQEKLIPTKWMASQLAIELTLAPPQSCIFQTISTSGVAPTYAVSNVNLIPEILEFDSSYDQLFLEGLRKGGVPLKFSSWHQYTFGVSGTQMNLLIQERSRSVKALFAVQRRSPDSITTDSGAMLFETAPNTTGGTLHSYQYRIGGR